LNFITGPQVGAETEPAATLNAGPPFSVKLNSCPCKLGLESPADLQTFNPRAGLAMFV
jgi:hypothetical protein